MKKFNMKKIVVNISAIIFVLALTLSTIGATGSDYNCNSTYSDATFVVDMETFNGYFDNGHYYVASSSTEISIPLKVTIVMREGYSATDRYGATDFSNAFSFTSEPPVGVSLDTVTSTLSEIGSGNTFVVSTNIIIDSITNGTELTIPVNFQLNDSKLYEVINVSAQICPVCNQSLHLGHAFCSLCGVECNGESAHDEWCIVRLPENSEIILNYISGTSNRTANLPIQINNESGEMEIINTDFLLSSSNTQKVPINSLEVLSVSGQHGSVQLEIIADNNVEVTEAYLFFKEFCLGKVLISYQSNVIESINAVYPNKNIEVGQEIKLSDITLTAVYTDGSSQLVTTGFSTDYDKSNTKLGERIVTVTYGDKITSFGVNVTRTANVQGESDVIKAVATGDNSIILLFIILLSVSAIIIRYYIHRVKVN